MRRNIADGADVNDPKPVHLHRQLSSRSAREISAIAAAAAIHENVEEEILRLIAERESRFRAEKAVALRQARCELEAERRARREAEAARRKAEEELEKLKAKEAEKDAEADPPCKPQRKEDDAPALSSPTIRRLKLAKLGKEQVLQEELDNLENVTMSREERVQAPNSVPEAHVSSRGSPAQHPPQSMPEPTISIDNERMVAELSRLKAEQDLEHIKMEKMVEEAKRARQKVEEDVEYLRLDKMEKEAEAARANAEEELERFRREDRSQGDPWAEHAIQTATSPTEAHETVPLIDARSKSEAARRKAEEELARTYVAKSTCPTKEEEKARALKTERITSDSLKDDDIVRFRHYYPSFDEDNEEEINSDKQEETETAKVEPTREMHDWRNLSQQGGRTPQGGQDKVAPTGEAAEVTPDYETSDSAKELHQIVAHVAVASKRENQIEDRAVATSTDQSVTSQEEHLTSPQKVKSDPNHPSSPLEHPPTISRVSSNGVDGIVLEDRGQKTEDEHDVPSTKITNGSRGHDFPSTTIIHAPMSPLASEPASAPESESSFNQGSDLETESTVSVAPPVNQVMNDKHDPPSTIMKVLTESEPVSKSSITKIESEKPEKDKADEAQIHHVARVTFDGDRSKGQLSFTPGCKIEAHSNQRGPWWLGRCGRVTGWFPASAVVPASKFLGSSITTTSLNATEEAENGVAQLSGEELNAVYDFIRNPSDSEPDSEGDSPAKRRWLTSSASGSNAADQSRSCSPPSFRSDPSRVAGLSERLYATDDEESHSNNDKLMRRSQDDNSSREVLNESKSSDASCSPEAIDEILDKDSSPKAQSKIAEISQIDELTRISKSHLAKTTGDNATRVNPDPKGWRATIDPKSGLVYYYHIETRKVSIAQDRMFEP